MLCYRQIIREGIEKAREGAEGKGRDRDSRKGREMGKGEGSGRRGEATQISRARRPWLKRAGARTV